MKALRFKDNRIYLAERSIPEPAEGEARIRVTTAGVCSTDLEIMKGYMNYQGTLGHEFVGIVDSAPALPEWEGKRVVGEINAGCGYCEWCRKEMPTHCPNRTVLGIQGRDGAFAEYLNLPCNNLHLVPDSLPDDWAVFTEPLAAAYEILSQVHIIPDTPVLVIGDGRLAQLVVRVISRAGGNVDVVGKMPDKLRKMKGFVRRAFVNQPPAEDKYPIVVEASGSTKGWTTAMEAVAPRGIIVLKSTYVAGFEFNPALIAVNEISIIGSRCGPFEPALKALAGGLDPTPLITATFPLDQWRDAMEELKKPELIKLLLKIS